MMMFCIDVFLPGDPLVCKILDMVIHEVDVLGHVVSDKVTCHTHGTMVVHMNRDG